VANQARYTFLTRVRHGAACGMRKVATQNYFQSQTLDEFELLASEQRL
jgi:hypothetical protein